jgi:hypothetical protein
MGLPTQTPKAVANLQRIPYLSSGTLSKESDQRKITIRPEPEEIEGETEYKVEWILQSEIHTSRQKVGRRFKLFKSLYFLVKWKGSPDNETTW